MEMMNLVVDGVNKVLWDYILIIALFGVGIYMTVRLRFPQFTRLMPALKDMVAAIIRKEKAEEGKMSPFQALATSVAAQVGTGNIVGVATAIAAGGPGAAFWMLVSAFFGMATIFSEAVLSQKYREKKNGEWVGGPAYYIKNGLKSKALGMFFAVSCIIALGIVGVMVQSNSVAGSVSSAFGVPVFAVAGVLAVVVALILMGGMGRIASFAETVVPAMAGLYILGSLLIILFNIGSLLPVIKMIFLGAFMPQAIGGGVLGITVQQTVRFGLARGLFSNEAGMGSTPHSHAVADAKHPAEQGFTAMIGVFISTFLICLSTVMVNLTSGAYNVGISAAEMTATATVMTQTGFAAGFGAFGGMFLSICLSFFSLTTIVGWYFFAESNVKLVFNSKALTVNVFKGVVISALVIGTLIDAAFVWKLADLFMGLMALPNIIAILMLSREVVDILNHYDSTQAEEEAFELVEAELAA
ncbi:alanine/glycine:cation symporter family protein [Acidaminobacter hydrogenoformans]|uniref:Alanine or glycine:cation symporter, AGCS family n=1 Tax=Acidaminobacter hydrogenoformans DSM 2784 TaxID=1120920 RepID=A0A1G5RXS1_9FIRM|nr:sodium:alanine symporter family protein [Acidaminobacter hydrogenoformans]SCZ78717.1 alanine or glycine:cation symporter, AGCS family [Acidaminobacter hydrogenoformans DSM 2784]